MRLKIAFTGPESTGKSSLSSLVAKELNGLYIPEFAREYLEKTNGYYEEKDLDIIAHGQYNSVQESKSNLIVVDTEMTVMKVWSLFKYGQVSETIENLYQLEKWDHLFLCDIDIPWEEDTLREHPESRAELFDIYHKLLIEKGVEFTIVKGSIAERLAQVIQVLKEKNALLLVNPK